MSQVDVETVPCELCGNPTPMKGTKRCDRCWELEHRIQCDPEIARKIIASLEPEDLCTYSEAVNHLYVWQHGKATSISAQLFTIFGKADAENRRRFASAFPNLFRVWCDWHAAPDSDTFFRQHGFTIT